MLTKAIARYIRVSPRKARLVADLVRGKTVAEALAILQYSPQIAARHIEKVLRSAVANAEHNHQVRSLDDLRVNAVIDGGPSLKRIQPRAMGRAFWIRHRLAHITVALAEAGAGTAPARPRPAGGDARAPERRPPTGQDDDEERVMGQKAHPIGFRLGTTRTWSSRWFASKEYANLLHEDVKIRRYIKDALYHAGISRIDVERSANRARITVHTARPGIIIGRKGAEVEKLKSELQMRTGKEIHLDIQEVVHPELDSQLVAENIALQLEKRVAFRRAMKKAVQSSVRLGAEGVRIACAGRLGGAEIARREWYRDGRVPLQTLRADLDFGVATAHTTYGTIGVKVWIFKGEVLPAARAAELG